MTWMKRKIEGHHGLSGTFQVHEIYRLNFLNMSYTIGDTGNMAFGPV